MISRIKIRFRRWWKKQLKAQNPYVSQMESSNCRFEFLLDQLDAAKLAEDLEQTERIEQLMDQENEYFRNVTDKARKLLGK